MIKLLMIAASLRKDSMNRKLIGIAEEIAKEKKATIDHAEFSEFDLPLYNQDIQDAKGLPSAAQHFIDRMNASDGLVIASPEYNFSTPGPLKNLIDWVSRATPMPWDGQHILLMSCSPALCGGNRGLWATRIPLECCGAFVHPKMYSLPYNKDTFDAKNQFSDPKNRERLSENISGFIKTLRK